ncbi:MAG: HAD hydrolase-like protein [Cytophagales bacterium]|nr:HAD hydrolase-like protein [Cytophagales bacterium]
MIQHVLFDFDGTLADSKEMALAILNRLAEKHQFRKIAPDDREALRKLSIVERCRWLGVPLYKIPLLAVEGRALYKSALPHLKPFNGVPEMLAALQHRGYRLSVLSSNSEGNIRAFLLRNGIDAISSVVGSSAIFGKDAAIKKFLKTHRLGGSQVIYVGDEERDVIACRKSGIPIIWVGWGYDAPEVVRPAQPDFMVQAPEEILSVLQSPGQ